MRSELLTAMAVILAVLTVLSVAAWPWWMLGVDVMRIGDETATALVAWLLGLSPFGVLAILWGGLWVAARLTRPPPVAC